MQVLSYRIHKLARISTDIGTFRVWDHGAIDQWDGEAGDWTCLQEEVTAADERMLHNVARELWSK